MIELRSRPLTPARLTALVQGLILATSMIFPAGSAAERGRAEVASSQAGAGELAHATQPDHGAVPFGAQVLERSPEVSPDLVALECEEIDDLEDGDGQHGATGDHSLTEPRASRRAPRGPARLLVGADAVARHAARGPPLA